MNNVATYGLYGQSSVITVTNNTFTRYNLRNGAFPGVGLVAATASTVVGNSFQFGGTEPSAVIVDASSANVVVQNNIPLYTPAIASVFVNLGANGTSNAATSLLLRSTGTANPFEIDTAAGQSLITATPAGQLAIGLGVRNPTEFFAVYGTPYAGTGTYFLSRYQPTVTSSAAAEVATYYNPIFSGGAGTTLGVQIGIEGTANNVGAGTITNAEAALLQTSNMGSGSITNAQTLKVLSANNSGAGTIINAVGVNISEQTSALNNTDLVVGANASSTGNFGLYNGSAYKNYFAGSVGIGTTTPVAKLDVNGTANFSGMVGFALGQYFPGTLTGATPGGGLAVSGVTLGLTRSCAAGQVLSWTGALWQCAGGGSGGGTTITGVTAGAGLSGGGTAGTVTLNIDTVKIPQLAAVNMFTADQNISGNLSVTGNIAKAGGSFRIDHPLDPANKYLSHSFVESPDMKNIYDGVVSLDGKGEAIVELPDWFGALNLDFRYQLTCIGGFAPVYISLEVANNQFGIAGGRSGMRVSWQVTGIRHDAWANAHRIPVVEDKPEQERGYYLHPELFNAPPERNVLLAEHPELVEQSIKQK